jgi:hypothetical protein
MKEELVKRIELFSHPKMILKCFKADVKLKELENEDICYPLSGAEYVLLELLIVSSSSGPSESYRYLFTTNHIVVRTFEFGDIYVKNSGATDMELVHNKLIIDNKGISSLMFVTNDDLNSSSLSIKLKHNNFRSIEFSPAMSAYSELNNILNEVLKIKRWNLSAK